MYNYPPSLLFRYLERLTRIVFRNIFVEGQMNIQVFLVSNKYNRKRSEDDTQYNSVSKYYQEKLECSFAHSKDVK